MKKIITLILSAFVFASALKASEECCAKNNDNANCAKEVTLSHMKGDITVKLNPQRVVILDFGVADTLQAFGLDPEVAIAKRALPKYLSKYQDERYVDIGSLKEFNLETINAFKPDFIVISTRQLTYYEELSKIAPVYLINRLPVDQMEQIKIDILNIGKVFGKCEEAKKAVADIEAKVASLKAKAEASDKKALFILTNDGKISAYGSGSRFGLVYDSLGFKQVDENIKVSTHGQQVNYEYIALKNPDIIYVVDRSVAIGEPTKSTKLEGNALISKTKAAKDAKIIMLDPQAWYLSGGGIQTLNIMIDDIAKGL